MSKRDPTNDGPTEFDLLATFLKGWSPGTGNYPNKPGIIVGIRAVVERSGGKIREDSNVKLKEEN